MPLPFARLARAAQALRTYFDRGTASVYRMLTMSRVLCYAFYVL